MDCRDKLESFFREHGVAFEVKEHPTAYTAQRIAATEHVPGRAFAKVVIARSDADLVMLVLPASSMVDVAKVTGAIHGEQVRLASEDEFAPTSPDREPGAMPPFGNPVWSARLHRPGDGRERPCRLPGRQPRRDDERRLRDFERLAQLTVVDIAVTR